jgi:hypothetical protein
LEYQKEGKAYKTTSKGLSFLGLYHNLVNVGVPDIIDKNICVANTLFLNLESLFLSHSNKLVWLLGCFQTLFIIWS